MSSYSTIPPHLSAQWPWWLVTATVHRPSPWHSLSTTWHTREGLRKHSFHISSKMAKITIFLAVTLEPMTDGFSPGDCRQSGSWSPGWCGSPSAAQSAMDSEMGFYPRANKQTLRNKQKEKESDKYFLICVLCLTYTILKCCISSVNQSCILQLANGLCSWKNWHISFVDKVDGYGFWRKVEQNRFQSVARTLEGKWLGVNVKALVWACKPKFNIMNPHQGTILSLCSISYLVYSLKFNIPILSQNNLTQ